MQHRWQRSAKAAAALLIIVNLGLYKCTNNCWPGPGSAPVPPRKPRRRTRKTESKFNKEKACAEVGSFCFFFLLSIFESVTHGGCRLGYMDWHLNALLVQSSALDTRYTGPDKHRVKPFIKPNLVRPMFLTQWHIMPAVWRSGSVAGAGPIGIRCWVTDWQGAVTSLGAGTAQELTINLN